MKIRIYEINVEYKEEDRQNEYGTLGGDSLLDGSFSFSEIKPRFNLNNIYNMNIYTAFGFREDNFPLNGVMLDQSNSYTQTYGVRYAGLQWLSTLFELTFRNKDYTEAFASETKCEYQYIAG